MSVSHHDSDRRQKLIDLIGEGWSIVQAAKEAGLARSYVYRLRDSDPRVKAAWDARPRGAAKRRAVRRVMEPPPGTPEPEPGDLEPAARGVPEGMEDRATEADLRGLGLVELARIARNRDAKPADRVAAAKALVMAVPPTSAPPAERSEPDEPEEEEPLTAEQVASIIGFRKA